MPPDVQKRLPACNACRLRRVKCDAVPPPESCSRCISKGIICTTTHAGRKSRTGVRVEAARAAFGSTLPLLQARLSPVIQAEKSMFQLELSGELTAHLLSRHAALPSEFIITGISLVQKFEAGGRRISMLPRTTQALTLATLAMSARISSHPLLFGTESAPPRLMSLLFSSSEMARRPMPEWGARRENACRRLRDIALETAWDAKLLRGQGGDSNEDEEMAACLLLGCIEDRYSPGQGQVWHAAFVSLLRSKLEAKRKAEWDLSSRASASGTAVAAGASSSSSPSSASLAIRSLRTSGLAWSIHIMRDALSAAARGHVCTYTLYDEELLSGLRPVDLGKVLEHSNTFGLVDPDHPREPIEGENIRADWWDFGAYYCLVRPFTYRMTEIAMRSYEWPLARTHRSPFDATKLENYAASLLPLQKLLTLAGDRLEMLLSPMAVDIRRYAGRGGGFHHVTGDQSEKLTKRFQFNLRPDASVPMQGTDGADGVHSPRDEFRAQETARSLHLFLRASMGACLFPIFNDIRERIQAIDNGGGCPGDDRELLGNALDSMQKALLPYVLTMLRSLSSIVHIAWVTSIGPSLRASSSPPGSSSGRSLSSTDVNQPVTFVTPTPVPYPETQTSVPPDSALLYPSSFAWEGKVMQMFRMCTAPHLFSRATWDEPFSVWTRVLLSSTPIEDGGTGLSRVEKLAGIKILLDVARVMAWAFPSMADDLIEDARKTYASMKALGISEDSADSNTSPDSSAARSHSLVSDSYSGILPKVTPAQSIPFVKEMLEGVPHERISDVFFGGSGATGLGLEATENSSRAIEELCRDISKLKISQASSHSNMRSMNVPLAQVAFNKPESLFSNMPIAGPSTLVQPPGASAYAQPLSMPQDFGAFNPTMNYAPSAGQAWNTARRPESTHSSYTMPTWRPTSQSSGSSQGFIQRPLSHTGGSIEEILQQQGYHSESSPASADGATHDASYLHHNLAPSIDPHSLPSQAELELEFQRLFGGRNMDQMQGTSGFSRF